ncbi:MAG: hypothetical protein KF768_00680 [Phycisphaeraceae bacterium]|nr:hypothetical protein [Phycisphaeraceae bacterium]
MKHATYISIDHADGRARRSAAALAAAAGLALGLLPPVSAQAATSALRVIGVASPLLFAAQPDPQEPDDPMADPTVDDDDATDGMAPAAPAAPSAVEGLVQDIRDAAAVPQASRGRRLMSTEPTVLAFRNVTVDQVIPFIVETTGKVVLPQQDILARTITILNDQPIARERALDLVFLALQQRNIAVVETEDLILLRDIAEIDRQDVPVIPASISVLDRTDLGSIVEKIFQLRSASAANIGEIVKGVLPTFAKLNVDTDSNQIIVIGNIGLLQRIERLIDALDQPNTASLISETFHLRYADANQVAQNIRDLFAADTRQLQQQQQQQQRQIQQLLQQRGGQAGRQQQGGAGGQTSAVFGQNLRVSANTQQNSVTIVAERSTLDEIRRQIFEHWDQPLPEEAVVPRIYELKNSDPVKVRDLLIGLFGRPGQATGNQQQAQRLQGQFSFEAIPEASRLVVISKSPDNLSVIDRIIDDLDRPQTAGLPRIVELKHASAEELAEQLNALLSQEGTLARIQRQETGLSSSRSSASPFASDATTQAQQAASTAGNIEFWWQRSRPPTNTAGSSNLVSKIRIVPVWRQNALMILSPPEYQESVARIIEDLDKPGRQVLLSAVIVEIGIDDLNALGVRWSSQNITPFAADNSLSIGAGAGVGQEVFSGQKNNLLPGLFDTSVLDIGIDLNVILQALSQKTSVNILSEPRIFTSDNQEAEFFSGQDIPFITDSQTTDNGTLNQSFDYRAVGIALRVRPRITIKKDVDLRINLELSSIQPNQTLFGGFIVDRRETTTHLIIRDGQTVVVSGILRSEDSEVRRKVPILGDIPLVGELFKSTEKTKNKTELVAFITPIVIENPEDAEGATAEERERLERLRERLDPSMQRESTPPPRVEPATPSLPPARSSPVSVESAWPTGS